MLRTYMLSIINLLLLLSIIKRREFLYGKNMLEELVKNFNKNYYNRILFLNFSLK